MGNQKEVEGYQGITTKQALQLTVPIGMAVRKVRTEHGLSIDMLAYLIDVKPQHLWQIEKGMIESPRWITIYKIAKVLDISLDDLIME